MTKELFIKSIYSLQAVEDFQRGVLNLLCTTAPYDENPVPFNTAEDLYNLLNKQRRKLNCPSTE